MSGIQVIEDIEAEIHNKLIQGYYVTVRLSHRPWMHRTEYDSYVQHVIRPKDIKSKDIKSIDRFVDEMLILLRREIGNPYNGKLLNTKMEIIECLHPPLHKNGSMNVLDEALAHIKQSVSSMLGIVAKISVKLYLKRYGRKSGTLS